MYSLTYEIGTRHAKRDKNCLERRIAAMSVINHFNRSEFFLRTQSLCGDDHPLKTKYLKVQILLSGDTASAAFVYLAL